MLGDSASLPNQTTYLSTYYVQGRSNSSSTYKHTQKKTGRQNKEQSFEEWGWYRPQKSP